MGDKLFSNVQGLWPKLKGYGGDQISSHPISFTEQAVFACLFLDIRAKKGKGKIVNENSPWSHERYKNFPFSLFFSGMV